MGFAHRRLRVAVTSLGTARALTASSRIRRVIVAAAECLNGGDAIGMNRSLFTGMTHSEYISAAIATLLYELKINDCIESGRPKTLAFDISHVHGFPECAKWLGDDSSGQYMLRWWLPRRSIAAEHFTPLNLAEAGWRSAWRRP
jgi:hypothetical protein